MRKKAEICLAAVVLLITSTCFAGQKKKNHQIVNFETAHPGVIKVMTFNIRVDTMLDGLNRWSGRRSRVIESLTKNAAEVVGLQEALAHQVEHIQKALPQYTHYAVGRDDGKNDGESCAIFYQKDRFVMDDCGTFWFSDTPDQPGSKDWGNMWPRICTWVHLKEKTSGTGFYVYNVHLDCFSQNSREKSVELLAEVIAARKTADPFIVMGDFNMSCDNPAMRYLQNPGNYPKMVNAWEVFHPGSNGPGTTRKGDENIDHIPLSEDIVALDVEVDRSKFNGRYASDHFPVIAKIFLPDSVKASAAAAAAQATPRKPQQDQTLTLSAGM